MLSRRTAHILLSVSLCSAMAGAARADAVRDARNAIQQAYDQGNAAMVRKDSAGVLKYYAPNWTSVGKNGQTMTLAQFKASIEGTLSQLRDVRALSKVTQIKLRGNQADVTVQDSMQASMVRQARPQNGGAAGKPTVLTIALTDVSHDTWIKSGPGWLRLQAHMVSGTRTANGKPF